MQGHRCGVLSNFEVVERRDVPKEELGAMTRCHVGVNAVPMQSNRSSPLPCTLPCNEGEGSTDGVGNRGMAFAQPVGGLLGATGGGMAPTKAIAAESHSGIVPTVQETECSAGVTAEKLKRRSKASYMVVGCQLHRADEVTKNAGEAGVLDDRDV